MSDIVDRRARVDPPTWRPVPDPTDLTFGLVDREIAHVKERVDLQFVLIERQRVESKTDTQAALAAALTAQEKAAQVLATFTADQLKALQIAFSTSIEQVRKDISELKENAKVVDGRAEGADVLRQLSVIRQQIDSNTSNILVGQGAKQGGREAITSVQLFLGLIVTLITIGVFIAALR